MFKFLDFLFLAPISRLWETIYAIRRFNYKFFKRVQSEFKVPVISVGNISFGGTGKTPFTIWLLKYFESQQKKVMVMMRGYKGGLENGQGIINANSKIGANPKVFGDEPLLIARNLKLGSVVVGKRRSKNLRYYFPRILPDIVLLDDGYQHLKIKRDLNFVLFDALMPLDKYKTAPRGYLREGLSSLIDADVAVIGRADVASKEKLEELKNFLQPHLRQGVPFVTFGYKNSGLYDQNYNFVSPCEDLKGKKVIPLTGIASPSAFFKNLKNLGADLLDPVTFPDHHDFKEEELARVKELAECEDALIVTTEKDIVKIRRVVSSERIVFLQIEIEILEGLQELQKHLDGIQ